MFRILPRFLKETASEFEKNLETRERALGIVVFLSLEDHSYRPDSPEKTPLYGYLLGKINQIDLPLLNNKSNGEQPVKIEEMTPVEKMRKVLSVAEETLLRFGQASEAEKKITQAFFYLLKQIPEIPRTGREVSDNFPVSEGPKAPDF